MSDSRNKKVPFLDISRKIARYHEGISAAIEDVLSSSSFILGDFVENFEILFAEYLGISAVVTCANGSDALEIALKSLNLGEGATVLTAANAGNYSSLAIQACGLRVKYLDIDSASWNLSIEEIYANLDDDVEAIIITHLYGIVNKDIMEIQNLCRSKNIKLIEDCAQAHGAMFNKKYVGTFGDVSTFSFYPTKNLGALGDGGAIATNSDLIAKKARMLRQYGWSKKYHVEIVGGRNSRLDAIQASVLSSFLPFLDKENEQRRQIVQSVYSSLANRFSFQEFDISNDVFHLLPISTSHRANLIEFLSQNGIETQIHYPIPDHLQSNFNFGRTTRPKQLPITEELSSNILSLPCYPELSQSELKALISALLEFNYEDEQSPGT
jgi:aminotransferase EvaB